MGVTSMQSTDLIEFKELQKQVNSRFDPEQGLLKSASKSSQIKKEEMSKSLLKSDVSCSQDVSKKLEIYYNHDVFKEWSGYLGFKATLLAIQRKAREVPMPNLSVMKYTFESDEQEEGFMTVVNAIRKKVYSKKPNKANLKMLGEFDTAFQEEGFFAVVNAIREKALKRKENPTQNNGFPRRLDSKLTAQISARVENKSQGSETSSGLEGFTSGINALKSKASREFTLEGITLQNFNKEQEMLKADAQEIEGISKILPLKQRDSRDQEWLDTSLPFESGLRSPSKLRLETTPKQGQADTTSKEEYKQRTQNTSTVQNSTVFPTRIQRQNRDSIFSGITSNLDYSRSQVSKLSESQISNYSYNFGKKFKESFGLKSTNRLSRVLQREGGENIEIQQGGQREEPRKQESTVLSQPQIRVKRIKKIAKPIESQPREETNKEEQNPFLFHNKWCMTHKGQEIQYYCRERGCRLGICKYCLQSHRDHDLLKADQFSAFQVKNELYQISKEWSRRLESCLVKTKEVKEILREIEEVKEARIKELRQYFAKLNQELMKRETELRTQLKEQMIRISSNFENRASSLQSKKQKIDEALAKCNSYSQGLKNSTTEQVIGFTGFEKTKELMTCEEQVQAVPIFDKTEIPVFFFDYSSQKLRSELSTLTRVVRQSELASLERLRDQTGGMTRNFSPSLRERITVGSPDDLSNNSSVNNRPAIKLQQRSNTQPVQSRIDPSKFTNNLSPQKDSYFWFRWNTQEVYQFDFKSNKWFQRHNAAPSEAFLYFSCNVYSPHGVYLIGGLNKEQKSSSRVTFFNRRNSFEMKSPMITSRAFFPGIHIPLLQQIYVFGGSGRGRDLQKCERHNTGLNKWQSFAPMPHAKNGAAACYMEHSKSIYILGGNSMERGELTEVQKYSIIQSQWSTLSVTLPYGCHDLVTFVMSQKEILVLGGNSVQDGDKHDVFTINVEEFQSNFKKLRYGGKCFQPPVYDQKQQNLLLFWGYSDQMPNLEHYQLQFRKQNWSKQSTTEPTLIEQSSQDRTNGVSQVRRVQHISSSSRNLSPQKL